MDNKFWFIIPLMAKSASKNWQFVCCLLERTITSILRQTDHRFGVVIIHHEMPELPPFIADRVHFIQANYPSIPQNSTRLQKISDQLCKHAIGLREIATKNTKYYMFVDADDLVSSTIVENTFLSQPDAGVILRTGVILDESSFLLWKVSRFNSLCGTCAIFRFDKNLPELLPEKIEPDLSNEHFIPSFVRKIYSIDIHTHYESNAKSCGLHFDEWHEPHALYRWDHGENSNNPKAFHLNLSKKIRHHLPYFLSKGKRWQPVKLDAEMRQAFNIF